MNSRSLLVISLGVLLFIISCKDKKAPEIIIHSPNQSTYSLDTITNSVDVNFNVSVTDNKTLKDVTISLWNSTDGSMDYYKGLSTEELLDGEYDMDTTISFTKMHRDYEFKVTAADNEQSITETFHFHIHKD